MVLLKALNLSALTPTVRAFLAERNVLTVADFIVQDVYSLQLEAERSMESSEFIEAARAVYYYMKNLQEGWSLGSDLLEESRLSLPTCCESFDALLDGGLREGTITELVGASATGKTQMCMQAAASIAYWMHSTIMYIDTGSAFSGQRVASILGGFVSQNQQRAQSQDDSVARCMKGIQRIGIYDIFSMLSFLHRLHESLQSKSKIGGEFSQLRLLIVDSASSVVSAVLGGNRARGHALMISLARCLNKLAIVNRIAVLITNHTVGGDEEGQIKPALGESWISVPHIRLWFARNSRTGVCEASLTKHASLACNRKAYFFITTAGLQSINLAGKSIIPSSPN